MASLCGHKAQFHLLFGGNRFPSLLNDRKELAHVVDRRSLDAALGMVLLNFQAFSGAMRADKSLRYQIVPAIMVYSLVRTLTADASPDDPRVRLVIDTNPQRMVKPKRSTLFVVVVGETARSADWQLAGYKRETNPELTKRDVISFPAVRACGTSTDVSLPCMMSRIGRSDYNRDRILSEEALPDILQRAGFNVLWVDNQSGCREFVWGYRLETLLMRSKRAVFPVPTAAALTACSPMR